MSKNLIKTWREEAEGFEKSDNKARASALRYCASVLEVSLEKRDHVLGEDARHIRLNVAIQDFLCELRIGPEELRNMANGYSPDSSGIIHSEKWKNPCCKIQISSAVANKLLEAGVNNII